MPFTDDEVQYFIKLNDIKFYASQQKPITGSNAYLLSLAVPLNKESDLMKAVCKKCHTFYKEKSYDHPDAKLFDGNGDSDIVSQLLIENILKLQRG